MTEVKHTPGPWSEANGNRHCGYSISAAGQNGGKLLIAETIGIDTMQKGRSSYEEGPTTVANARLIAAAPDLLAAIKAAMAFLDEKGYGGDIYRTLNQAVNKAEPPSE